MYIYNVIKYINKKFFKNYFGIIILKLLFVLYIFNLTKFLKKFYKFVLFYF